MISSATKNLVLAGEMTMAIAEHQRTTDCSIGEAIQIIRKWRKDRADKIGRIKE